jgi:hypothetical protein
MKRYLCILTLGYLLCTQTSYAQDNQTSISDTIDLPEVIVSADRPLVKRKADRMIVSVEHSNLLKSRSLSNILNLIPGVDYDGEGGVTVMGNGIKIYENGKLVKLSGAQLKRYLSSMRGNDIKDLEILPQATAEFDAEGSTGILVINRQRKHEYGLSGYVGSEYERKSRNSFSEFTGLTYSWNKFALYANLTLGQTRSRSKITENDYGEETTVISMSESLDKGRYYTPKFGFDFNISPKQYLGVEWSGDYAKDYSNDGYINSVITDKSPYQTNIRCYAPYTMKPNNNNATLNYELEIDSLGSKLNVVADYVGEREHDLYGYENKYTLGESADSIISKSYPSFERIDIYSAKADFTKCFSRQHQFTVGAKYVHAGMDYDSKLHLGNTTLNGTLSEDIDQRDDFNYAEQRYAVYGVYRYTSQPWSLQVGLRDEYTEWKTKQNVKDKLHNSRSDNNIFPSFFVRRNMGQGNTLSLSYAQSINRPSYQMVNPFVFRLSETSYKEGNPDLKGELQYNAALQFILKSKYVFSLYAHYADRMFNELYEQVGERQTRYMLKNDGNARRFTLYMEAPFTLGIWNSRNSAELSQSLFKNSANSVSDFGVALSSFNRFRVSKQFSAMANLRFVKRYKRLYLIQKSDYFGVDLEGDYSCLKDKINVNFGVKDLLNRRGKSKQLFRNGDFEHYTAFDFVSRKFFVSVTYDFSTGKKKAVKHEKSHSNEEEKGRM